MIQSRPSTRSSPGTCAPCPKVHRSKPKKIAARWHVWNRFVAPTRRPHRRQRSHPTPPRPPGTLAPHCRPIPPHLQNRFPKNRPSHPRPPPPRRAGQVVQLTNNGQTPSARPPSARPLRPRYGVGFARSGFGPGSLLRPCAGSYSRLRLPAGLTKERILIGVPSRSDPTMNPKVARP